LKDKKVLTLLNLSKNILVVIFIFSLFFFNNHFADKVQAPIGYFEAKATTEEERKQMEKELAEIEAQIAKYEAELQTTTKEKTTLQNAINALKTQANKLSLQVKSTKTQITSITGKIKDTETAIDKTLNNIINTKQELSSLIQAFYELSTKSQAEIILANNTLSDYFTEVNSLNLLDLKINDKLGELHKLNKDLNEQKTDLNEKKGDAQNMLQVQLLQQNELDRTKKERESLLTVTKNKEATYQQILSEQRKKANELRSRIYNLVGIQTKVTFGEALDIAT
jgi:septal ring factor EnvC (AmiA/AmiB activator)